MPSQPSSPPRRGASATPLWTGGLVVALLAIAGSFGALGASGEAESPGWLTLAALAMAFALGALGGAWRERRERRRLGAAAAELVGAAAPLLGAQRGQRLPAVEQPELRPLAELLQSLAEARDQLADRLDDRDGQLALTRRLTGWIYWEQDADGRYVRIENETDEQTLLARQLLGRTRWERGGMLIGRSIAAAAANPATDGDWSAHREQLARGRPFAELVWSLPVEGGGRAFLVESGRPRLDAEGAVIGYGGLLREIGGALAAERASQNALTALRVAPEPSLLIEASDAPPGWRVAWANAAACAMLGRTDTEIVSTAPQALFGSANGSAIATIAEALAAGRGVRLACELPDRYGHSRGVAIRVDPVAPLEGLRAQAGLSIDYLQVESERMRERAESAHRLLAEQSSRLQELEQVSRELEAFSYTVSHDLRAPLRVVDGFARILRDDFADGLASGGREHLDRILAAASRMDHMIDALLGLARVSAQPLVPAPVDLTLLAQQIADELRSQEPGRQVEFVIARSMVASGDRTLLRIVLENLLGNAWKYTGRAAKAVVEFDCSLQGQTLVYRIADNGAGFDMRYADRLFGAFQRLHGASEFAGTGVGLATVARIVQRHRGRIWADSTPGEGARFFFTLNELPAAAPAAMRRPDA